MKQKTGLDTVESIMVDVKDRVQNNEDILIEFKEMWGKLKDEKKVIEDREIR
jgi:hypothetical protein